MAMEERDSEPVLYETRRHASKPYTPNYPPQQIHNGASSGLLSMLSVQGVSRLKEKWLESKQPRKLRKLASLFLSPSGEHVAVSAGSQITILQKKDDYSNPCGTFTAGSHVTFSIGTWSESHAVLGVVDDEDTLYFIKENGIEISRIMKRQLKISSPIVKLLANDDSRVENSYLCSFTIVTSNGSLQHVEISREPNNLANNCLTLQGRFPQSVCGIDYHNELLLLAVVSSSDSTTQNTGSCILSLWHKSNSMDLEQLFTIPFEGLYTKPKGHNGHLAYPKVLISPAAEFVCTLDAVGLLHSFKLDKKCFSLSKFAVADSSLSTREMFADVVDFTWWSDHVLVIAKRASTVFMIDMRSGLKVQENETVYSMPVIERVYQSQGNLVLLESMSSDKETDGSLCIEQITEDKFDHLHMTKLSWNLVTFLKRSVLEMYGILISNKKYQAALDFADFHGLGKDEVLKSQWLHSTQGIDAISKYLSKIKDTVFVLTECVDKVGPTEDSTKALLEFGLHLTNQYRFSDLEDCDSTQISLFRMARLQILQFRDRMETYLGINMGRFSVQEYAKFRVMPINEAAVALAESGKMGALNLLFKRHPYSLAPFVLEILSSIPETLPVQTYGQLLPGRSPPSCAFVREEDWVECKKMVEFIQSSQNNHEIDVQIRTEAIVKRCLGIVWPSSNELYTWYRNRTRDIDMSSGQLDNCLSLLDFADRKGISELKQFHKDVLYLHQLIYSDDSDGGISLNLATWEQFSDYEKFKMMLKGVQEENVIEKLREKAIPFMKDRFQCTSVSQVHPSGDHDEVESFLVGWLKELASQNKLDICLRIIEEGCGDVQIGGFFNDDLEAISCALQCLYLCKATDKWSTMMAILSKLPQMQGSTVYDGGLERRLKLAEGHIEVGRLLSLYQVPKPMDFFLEPHGDGKDVKQILRLILSKFVRRHLGRSDNDWASMWRDMQCLREKAFPFLDSEYMLMEFCRGLLKAGKFSLARNYLKGTGSVTLPSDKAENLVIQAAREYFFSASSLGSPEIWKAKECLNILSSSRLVTAELDIIDAITVKLPSLGVTLLPMQFKQIKDQMEIIKMAITSQNGAYLHVDEIIEIAKLLGLCSSDDISAVQEAIAREAAVAGDLQLALDMCLVLAKKGHGQVWDLCAAIARGPALESMNIKSRKQLLGFSLSHCDEESISELLHAWKDLDMQGNCEMLMESRESATGENKEVSIGNVVKILSAVAKDIPAEKGRNWESVLEDDGKTLSFAASQLPWLLELSSRPENYGSNSRMQYMNVRTQAVVTILSWLARNGFAPKDDVIATLAKSMIGPPMTEEKDVIFCAYLLNLVDAFGGTEIIEEQLRRRKDYQEISSIMNAGMIYSLLHTHGIECQDPAQRRAMLLQKFREKQTPDEITKFDEVQSTFWREWKLKLEKQKFLAGKNGKGFSAEIHSDTIPGERWDEVHSTSEERETSAIQGLTDHKDTSTLVALKSSQLVATISPTIEVTPDDLSTVDSAISCFLKLSEISLTNSHIDYLVAVLGEWEGIFMAENHDEDASLKASDLGNTWNGDEWDEGWETFHDAEPPKEKTESAKSLHPLHVCWLEIFKKLIVLSRFNDLLRLIDQSNGILLNEDGAETITQILLQDECLMALKFVLLLPYEALHKQCLTALEYKLTRDGFAEHDHEFLILVSSSGVISSIVSESSYGTIFSYVCYLVGNLSHKYQTAQLSSLGHEEGSEVSIDSEKNVLLFRRLVFPYFVAELIKADQQLLAGLIVTKFMHTNASLNLINISESSLARFLEGELQLLRGDEVFKEATSHETLKSTVSDLVGKLETLVQSAFSLLSSGNVR